MGSCSAGEGEVFDNDETPTIHLAEDSVQNGVETLDIAADSSGQRAKLNVRRGAISDRPAGSFPAQVQANHSVVITLEDLIEHVIPPFLFYHCLTVRWQLRKLLEFTEGGVEHHSGEGG